MGCKELDTTQEHSFILPGAEVIQKVPLIISYRNIFKSNFYFYQNIYAEKNFKSSDPMKLIIKSGNPSFLLPPSPLPRSKYFQRI